jgi:hypothetical protein
MTGSALTTASVGSITFSAITFTNAINRISDSSMDFPKVNSSRKVPANLKAISGPKASAQASRSALLALVRVWSRAVSRQPTPSARRSEQVLMAGIWWHSVLAVTALGCVTDASLIWAAILSCADPSRQQASVLHRSEKLIQADHHAGLIKAARRIEVVRIERERRSPVILQDAAVGIDTRALR